MEQPAHASEPHASRGRRVLCALLEPLAIDMRSLAAFRIAIAIVLLVDLATRAVDLSDHYTDHGFYPRSARIALERSDVYDGEVRYQWSLHMLSGESWAQAVLFLIAALFAAGMLLGYRTRLCTIASSVLLSSLHARNPLVLDAGDTLLRCIMIWAMFLPLGGAASVDRRRDAIGKPRRQKVLSVASAALLLQVAVMYWFTAAAKNDPIWTHDYSAIYYVLNVDIITTPLGHWLLGFPELLRGLTFCTYWLELVGPCIALCPFLTRWPRAVVVLCFWLLHLGMALTMALGILEWVVIAAWLPFVPGVVWDALGRCFGKDKVGASAKRAGIERMLAWLDQRVFTRPAAADFRLSKASGAIVSALLLYTAVWNLHELSPRFREAVHFPKGWSIPGRITRLEQWWWMFAPQPMMNDGWYVMKGVLKDGSIVNLWEPGEPLPLTKPASVLETYRNERWRRYLMSLWEPMYTPTLRECAQWLEQRWNEQYSGGKPERKVKNVEIIYYLEETLPPDRISPSVTPMILWKTGYEALWAPTEAADGAGS
jgi:hypothetical protein